MKLTFKALSPHDFLVQQCSCGEYTIHGPVAALQWLWKVPRVSVRPLAFCGCCRETWDVAFDVELEAIGDERVGV